VVTKAIVIQPMLYYMHCIIPAYSGAPTSSLLSSADGQMPYALVQ